ncbi:importin-11-like [Salvelinus sp. IW2-2015]|uniref:importin-11-like n=1 Tax=Salvelinus sp. IW2-2015 TaxID=2691554 RepID=UPI0038D42FB7
MDDYIVIHEETAWQADHLLRKCSIKRTLCLQRAKIATQEAVLIAMVACLDCPHQWPELITILLEPVKDQDRPQQNRALFTFYHITKTLASKRLF